MLAEAFAAAPAQFLLQVLRALTFHFFRYLHIAAVIGAGGTLAKLAAQRVAPLALAAAGAVLAVAPATWLIALPVLEGKSHPAGVAVLALATFAGAGAAELAGHLLAHFPPAALQRLNRLLRGSGCGGVLALGECLHAIAHRQIGIVQAGRDFAGQIANLLHHLPQGPAQGLLYLGIALALAGMRRLWGFRLRHAPARAGVRRGAALGMIQHLRLTRDQILHHTHLLAAALAAMVDGARWAVIRPRQAMDALWASETMPDFLPASRPVQVP